MPVLIFVLNFPKDIKKYHKDYSKNISWDFLVWMYKCYSVNRLFGLIFDILVATTNILHKDFVKHQIFGNKNKLFIMFLKQYDYNMYWSLTFLKNLFYSVNIWFQCHIFKKKNQRDKVRICRQGLTDLFRKLNIFKTGKWQKGKIHQIRVFGNKPFSYRFILDGIGKFDHRHLTLYIFLIIKVFTL